MAFYDSKCSFQANELREIFNQIDTNKNGTVNKFELKKFLNVKDSSILDNIFGAVDSNKDEMITFEEFLIALESIAEK